LEQDFAAKNLFQDSRERASRKVSLFTLVASAARWRFIHFLDGLAGPNGLRRHRLSALKTRPQKLCFFVTAWIPECDIVPKDGR
jgi:hypothetical protein